MNVLRASNLVKRFGSLTAVDDVSLDVGAGEVVAVVGENGAGKTTLMSMLFGLLRPDEGEVVAGPQMRRVDGPHTATESGLGMVHQHFKLVPSFTVAQNVWLGDETTTRGFIDDRHAERATAELAERFGLAVDPTALVSDLPVGVRQRVEIIKALRRDASVLILDEPTAVLTPPEVRELLRVVRQLAGEGRSVLLITHKLDEVMDVADRIVIMRQARVVAHRRPAETSIREIASLMVGRDPAPPRRTEGRPGTAVLGVEGLVVRALDGSRAVRSVDLEVRSGEIVGIAGVSGNGQAELVSAVAGLERCEQGRIRLGDEDITRWSPRRRRRAGLAHVPEDRLETGLDLEGTLDENLGTLVYRDPPFARFGLLQRTEFGALAQRLVDAFSIRGTRPGGRIDHLSGGNLQKVVLARELSGRPQALLANQPTRGLDVGSIEFVHGELLRARDEGVAVLVVSAELDELLAIADRIAVMHRGHLIGPFDHSTVDREALGLMMATGEEIYR